MPYKYAQRVYVDRNDDSSAKPVCSECSDDEVNQNDNSDDKQHEYPMKLQNSDVLSNLDEKLGHL